MPTISIVGGGISGLSAAHYLCRSVKDSAYKIVVYEASERLGGWIRTENQSTGTYFETGPRSLR